MLEQGIPKPTKAIPIKLILPLLQAASLEEDDYLQDLWAKLLVNGANANSGIDLTKAFIEILESLTPLEAKILEIIYSLPFKITQHKGIITGELPHQASPAPDDPRQNLKEPTDEVMLALGNLARHRCISFPASYGGGEVITTVNPTFLGKKFVEACSLQKVDPSKNS